MTVAEIHEQILKTAAEIANKRGDIPPEAGTNPFFEANNRSTDASLTLGIPEAVMHLPDQVRSAEVLAKLEEIAVESVQEALLEHQDLFIGLILGQARAGNNYFDRYRYE